MPVEISMEEDAWQAVPLEAIAAAAFAAVLRELGLDPEQWEAGLLACGDARIAGLNAGFRGKAEPTNVLSWPEHELAAAEPGGIPPLPRAQGPEPGLGDIAIAYETCLREAEKAAKPLDDHATHLIVHGVLHLLGYDHIRDEDATLMEGLEARILGRLGLDNPYSIADGP